MNPPRRVADAWIGRLGPWAWEDRLLRGFLARGPLAYRVALLVLVTAVVVTLGMLLWFGCSHQWSCAWDSAFLLDGGWRLLAGQRPHVDFYSPLGVVPLGITALGMAVAGPCGSALGFGYAIVFPVVTFAAWGIARRRLPALAALIFALLVGFTLVATHYPGHPFHDTTYAAQYNRLGGALLAVLMLQVLIRAQDSTSRTVALVEGVLAGAMLALLLFTKITYFGMGVVALGVGTLAYGARSVAWTGVAGGFAAIVLAVLGYLGFDLGAFWADMRMVAAVQAPDTRLVALANAVRWNRGALGLLLAMIALLARPMRDRAADPGQPGWLFTSAIAAAAMLVGLVIYSTDGISGIPPAFTVAALVLAEGFRRRCVTSERLTQETFEPGFKYLLASVLVAYLAGVIIVHGSLSVAYSFGWHWAHTGRLPSGAIVRSETMRDVILPPRADERRLADEEAVIASILKRDPDEPALSSYQYACWVNDGLGLLRGHVDAGSRVFVVDWVNPFSFALEIPSPRGDALYWHAGRVFDDEHFPAAERVFEEVTLVMVPKRALQPASKRTLQRVYGRPLELQFRQIDESRLWVLYGRRDAGPDTPNPAE